MASKGVMVCHWCKELLHRTDYATEQTLVTFAGVYIAVCGPTCPERPEGAPVVKRGFGTVHNVTNPK